MQRKGFVFWKAEKEVEEKLDPEMLDVQFWEGAIASDLMDRKSS